MNFKLSIVAWLLAITPVASHCDDVPQEILGQIELLTTFINLAETSISKGELDAGTRWLERAQEGRNKLGKRLIELAIAGSEDKIAEFDKKLVAAQEKMGMKPEIPVPGTQDKPLSENKQATIVDKKQLCDAYSALDSIPGLSGELSAKQEALRACKMGDADEFEDEAGFKIRKQTMLSEINDIKKEIDTIRASYRNVRFRYLIPIAKVGPWDRNLNGFITQPDDVIMKSETLSNEVKYVTTVSLDDVTSPFPDNISISGFRSVEEAQLFKSKRYGEMKIAIEFSIEDTGSYGTTPMVVGERLLRCEINSLHIKVHRLAEIAVEGEVWKHLKLAKTRRPAK